MQAKTWWQVRAVCGLVSDSNTKWTYGSIVCDEIGTDIFNIWCDNFLSEVEMKCVYDQLGAKNYFDKSNFYASCFRKKKKKYDKMNVINYNVSKKRFLIY